MINLNTIIKNKVNRNHCCDDNRVCLELDDLIGLDIDELVKVLANNSFAYLVFSVDSLKGEHLNILRRVVAVSEGAKVTLLSSSSLPVITQRILKELPISVICLPVPELYQQFSELARLGELNMLFNQYVGSYHLEAKLEYQKEFIGPDDLLIAANCRDDLALYALADEFWDCNLLLVDPSHRLPDRLLLKVM